MQDTQLVFAGHLEKLRDTVNIIIYKHGMVGRYAWSLLSVLSITAAGQLKGKGQEPACTVSLGNCVTIELLRGTVDKFAGQSPQMWDAWQLCQFRLQNLQVCKQLK